MLIGEQRVSLTHKFLLVAFSELFFILSLISHWFPLAVISFAHMNFFFSRVVSRDPSREKGSVNFAIHVFSIPCFYFFFLSFPMLISLIFLSRELKKHKTNSGNINKNETFQHPPSYKNRIWNANIQTSAYKLFYRPGPSSNAVEIWKCREADSQNKADRHKSRACKKELTNI